MLTRAMGALTMPLLLSLPPEAAHRATIAALKYAPLLPKTASPPALAVNAFGLDFPNPIGMAAGFDKNAEVARRAAGARLRLRRGRHADAAPAKRQSAAAAVPAGRATAR